MKNSTKRQHNYQGNAGVYLVIAPQWSDNLCKVGMSTNLNKRVKSYCYSNCPNILEKKYFCENHKDMERRLIQAFSDHDDIKLKYGNETFKGDVNLMIELFDILTGCTTNKKDAPELEPEPEPKSTPTLKKFFTRSPEEWSYCPRDYDAITVYSDDLKQINKDVLEVFKTLEKDNKDFTYITKGQNYTYCGKYDTDCLWDLTMIDPDIVEEERSDPKNWVEKLPCDGKTFYSYFAVNNEYGFPEPHLLEAIGYAYRLQKWWKRVKN